MLLRRARPLWSASTSCIAMTETRLDVLFLNPELQCKHYAGFAKQRTTRFFASRIHHFGEASNQGKLWQVRTIQVKGEFILIPVIINTGGTSWRLPIISSPAIKEMLLLDSAVVRPSMVSKEGHTTVRRCNKYDVVFPNPLDDDAVEPLMHEWDDDRLKHKEFEKHGVIFNLAGHELAEAILDCDSAAADYLLLVEEGTPAHAEERLQESVRLMAKRYSRQLDLDTATVHANAEREVRAMIESAQTGIPWTETSSTEYCAS